jgi:hypothetical protein
MTKCLSIIHLPVVTTQGRKKKEIQVFNKGTHHIKIARAKLAQACASSTLKSAQTEIARSGESIWQITADQYVVPDCELPNKSKERRK